MNDLKPFKHGEEGTHGACKEMVVKLGAKVGCCQCNNHQCAQPTTDIEKRIEEILYRVNRLDNDTIDMEYAIKDIKDIVRTRESQIKQSLIKEIRGKLPEKWEHDSNCRFGQGEMTDSCVCETNTNNAVIDEVLSILGKYEKSV